MFTAFIIQLGTQLCTLALTSDVTATSGNSKASVVLNVVFIKCTRNTSYTVYMNTKERLSIKKMNTHIWGTPTIYINVSTKQDT